MPTLQVRTLSTLSIPKLTITNHSPHIISHRPYQNRHVRSSITKPARHHRTRRRLNRHQQRRRSHSSRHIRTRRSTNNNTTRHNTSQEERNKTRRQFPFKSNSQSTYHNPNKTRCPTEANHTIKQATAGTLYRTLHTTKHSTQSPHTPYDNHHTTTSTPNQATPITQHQRQPLSSQPHPH